jgi:hypothetical protein
MIASLQGPTHGDRGSSHGMARGVNALTIRWHTVALNACILKVGPSRIQQGVLELGGTEASSGALHRISWRHVQNIRWA